MEDVRVELRNIVEKAKQLHLRERQITVESVQVIDALQRRNAAVNMNMTSERFAVFIGLTPNQYWKRGQAARVIQFFPETLEMLKAGELHVSLMALIAPKITEANSEILLAGIKNKSRREAEGFLSRVTRDGRILDKEPEFDLRLRLNKSQMDLLDRAREVLSYGGHVPSLPEIMVKALGDLLDKRDPLCKAERAAIRAATKMGASPGKGDLSDISADHFTNDTVSETVPELSPDSPSPGKGDLSAILEDLFTNEALSETLPDLPLDRASPGTRDSAGRPAVPAAIRHAVWARDAGQCTWRHPDGSRCPEKGMLELDHLEMWCHGGKHAVDNLVLLCRRHNQFSAERHLGAGFMAKARSLAEKPPQKWNPDPHSEV